MDTSGYAGSQTEFGGNYMNGACNHRQCYPDTSCVLGNRDRRKCPHWRFENGKEPPAPSQSELSDIPWNSYALAPSDLTVLAARGRPIVIGLVGVPKSGKTSLLMILYMWLLKNGALGEYFFAGSWTLGGWESIAQNARWSSTPPPAFPPHTSSDGRRPGLLHISFRKPDGSFRDVLFTDAPGEWFVQWSKTHSVDPNSPASWVVSHSDALLLLADSEALGSSATLPKSRRETLDLVDQVAAAALSVPVTFVWAKSDIEIPFETRRLVDGHRKSLLGEIGTASTSVGQPTTIKSVFLSLLQQIDTPQPTRKLESRRPSTDPFLWYTGGNQE